ncbi:MAG: hypothetical protein ACR2GA_00675 [Chloroflexota bacterium]
MRILEGEMVGHAEINRAMIHALSAVQAAHGMEQRVDPVWVSDEAMEGRRIVDRIVDEGIGARHRDLAGQRKGLTRKGGNCNGTSVYR